MAELAWFDKLVKTNQNVTLKDAWEYRTHEVLLAVERSVKDKIDKIDGAVKSNFFTKAVGEDKKKSVRADAMKAHPNFSVASMAERLQREVSNLLTDDAGNTIEGLTFFDAANDLIHNTETTLKLFPKFQNEILEFFATELSIPKEKMRPILSRKSAEGAVPAKVAVAKPVEIKETKIPANSPQAEAAVASPDGTPKVTIINGSDTSHVVNVTRVGRDIIITLLNDSRSGLPGSGANVHSRKRVQLYADEQSPYKQALEYDVHSTYVTL